MEIAASISSMGIFTAAEISPSDIPANLSCSKMIIVATWCADNFTSFRFFVTNSSTRPDHSNKVKWVANRFDDT